MSISFFFLFFFEVMGCVISEAGESTVVVIKNQLCKYQKSEKKTKNIKAPEEPRYSKCQALSITSLGVSYPFPLGVEVPGGVAIVVDDDGSGSWSLGLREGGGK